MANVYDLFTADKHVVCESSLLKSTITGHIYSLKAHKQMDNGSIVARGAWVEAQVFDSKDYVEGEAPLLVLTTPIGYNSDRRTYQDECYFFNAQGEIMRAYELCEGDIFTVSDIAITALADAPVVGNYVAIDGGLYAEAADAAEAGFVGQIVEKVSYTNRDAYRILVVKTGV